MKHDWFAAQQPWQPQINMCVAQIFLSKILSICAIWLVEYCAICTFFLNKSLLNLQVLTLLVLWLASWEVLLWTWLPENYLLWTSWELLLWTRLCRAFCAWMLAITVCSFLVVVNFCSFNHCSWNLRGPLKCGTDFKIRKITSCCF